ncbi:hypothetical protein [Chryseobacterium sp. MFBS3-17]|uniref:hypothetical protein n=1 Tax=Chryseobacterium sp. MFBS3-17 TaxID=2886689 RepID=UPI001D0E043E|nr:hypothetical protein [Chryseobacterium sp. MFBS3-17]MCC2590445.1 hypothetical protein [Chryseobacterium sp. MFBS3-17]
MATINTILDKIKDVPLNRLEELHQYIRSLIPKSEFKTSDDWWNQISADERESIEEGLKDVEKSRMVSHEEFMKSFGR